MSAPSDVGTELMFAAWETLSLASYISSQTECEQVNKVSVFPLDIIMAIY